MRQTPGKRLTLEILVPRDIFGALAAMGIDAEERGNEAVALCPNPKHDDHSPSWSCNLDDGRHHCFVCGFGGSFIYLTTKMLGMPTPDASQWIRARKIKDVAEGFIGPRPRQAKRASGLSEADLWKFTDPPAAALASRGLTAEACKTYDVRWDVEHEYWITTVRDPFTRRLWGWQEKGGGRHFRNRPIDVPKSKTVFGYSDLSAGAVALLVESPLDVPFVRALYDHGVFPVSGYGVSISREQVSLIRERASMVILALDNDEAGWKGVSRLAFAFGTTPVRVFNYATTGPDVSHPDGRIATKGDGRDPGNLSADEIAWGIRHAIPAWEVKIPWL